MTNPIEELKEKIATMQHNLKVLEQLEASTTDVEKAYRDAYGHYPETSSFAVSDWDVISWEAFQKGYEAAQPKEVSVEEQTKPMEEVVDRLENKWNSAAENSAAENSAYYITDEVVDRLIKQQQAQKLYNRLYDEPEHYDEVEWDEKDNPKPMNEVLDRLENKWNSATENSASYITDEVVNRMLKKWEENPPEFLKFELGETLETRIYKWWTTCYSKHWTIDECTADLLDIVELFLPREQSAEGSQNINTEVAVEAHNELLQKIKSKLRNKK